MLARLVHVMHVMHAVPATPPCHQCMHYGCLISRWRGEVLHTFGSLAVPRFPLPLAADAPFLPPAPPAGWPFVAPAAALAPLLLPLPAAALTPLLAPAAPFRAGGCPPPLAGVGGGSSAAV